MNHFFKYDGPVFVFLTKFCDVLILSTLWILFSIPLVTIGPASAALYHSVNKILFQNEGYTVQTFWKSFCANLKQGVLLTLLCIPVAAFAVVSYLFSRSLSRGNILEYLYFAISILTALFLIVMLTYVFPVLSRFYMTIPEILKASVALAVTRIGFTLLLGIIFILCTGAFLIAPFIGFILPACYSMASVRLLEPGFKKLVSAREE